MKRIEELYQEILEDEGLKGEFVQAAKDNQVEAFLQKNDCTATLSELQEFAEKEQSKLVSLSDAELDAAAGGADLVEALASMVFVVVGCVCVAVLSVLGNGLGPREGSSRWICQGGSGPLEELH